MSETTATPARRGRDWRRHDPAPGFGQAMRTARLAKGLSPEALADAAAVGRDSVYRLEAGTRKPSRSMTQRLAAVLGDEVMIAAGFIPPGYTAVKRKRGNDGS